MAENPEEAAKVMREAGDMAKAEVDSVAKSFERFKAALEAEMGNGAGGTAARNSGGKRPPASTAPKSGRKSKSGDGINSDIAERVQRRRRR